MSDDGQSSDDKGFLARWSQRKREAKLPDRAAPAAEAAVPAEPVAEAEPELDLSSLPKLEEMTATTDITGFLRKGVPEHLRNAALQKSWALDPAVRNYVNPALDYAYDWNTPGGVPGSSEIGASMDVARLVSQIMGGGEPAVETSVSAAEPGTDPANDSAGPSGHDATQEVEPELPTEALRLTDERIPMAQKPSNPEDVARLDAAREDEVRQKDSVAPQQTARRHGSAKPLV
jgi:Protein of unknown function (DUF3306)